MAIPINILSAEDDNLGMSYHISNRKQYSHIMLPSAVKDRHRILLSAVDSIVTECHYQQWIA